ncbi:hypothetical protein HDK64DRAFT_254960 [Phyllosticta capitalensis]
MTMLLRGPLGRESSRGRGHSESGNAEFLETIDRTPRPAPDSLASRRADRRLSVCLHPAAHFDSSFNSPPASLFIDSDRFHADLPEESTPALRPSPDQLVSGRTEGRRLDSRGSPLVSVLPLTSTPHSKLAAESPSALPPPAAHGGPFTNAGNEIALLRITWIESTFTNHRSVARHPPDSPSPTAGLPSTAASTLHLALRLLTRSTPTPFSSIILQVHHDDSTSASCLNNTCIILCSTNAALVAALDSSVLCLGDSSRAPLPHHKDTSATTSQLLHAVDVEHPLNASIVAASPQSSALRPLPLTPLAPRSHSCVDVAACSTNLILKSPPLAACLSDFFRTSPSFPLALKDCRAWLEIQRLLGQLERGPEQNACVSRCGFHRWTFRADFWCRLYRQALQYLDDVEADAAAIKKTLEEKWPEFKGFSSNTRLHLIDKMAKLKDQGANNNTDAMIRRALSYLDDVPADPKIIQHALYERWPELDFGEIKAGTLDLVISEACEIMKEEEFGNDEALFRLALEHLGDVANEEDSIAAALWERCPEYQELERSTRRFLVMKVRQVMTDGPADPDWLVWFNKKPLQSEGTISAAEWLSRSMCLNDRQVWLVDCSYYQPTGSPDLGPLIWEIGIVSLKTGELVLSTKVNYKSATPVGLYKELYGKEPNALSKRFAAFKDAFDRNYNSGQAHGMTLSDIEHSLRNRGYDPKTHQLVSYNDVAITAVAKLFMKDYRVSAQVFDLEMLNRDHFQPVSIKSMVEEIYGTTESDDLGIVYGKMFPDARNDIMPTTGSNAKALWRVCTMLYHVFGFRDI